MGELLNTVETLWPFVVIPWAILLISVSWRPQRFRNCFYLLFCCGTSLLFIAGLFGKYANYALLAVVLLCMLGLLLVPVLLIFNGFQMLRREGRSPANILSLLLGVVVGCGELAAILFALRIGDYTSMLRYRLLWAVFISVFYFSFLILAFVLYSLFMYLLPHRRRDDYIIIHGAGLLRGSQVSRLLADRLDKAIQLFHRGGDKPMLIPSGGQGGDETISEAQAMTAYLLAHGVPREKILPEDSSTSTMENLVNSKAIIESRPGSHRTVLVSSNYHVYRCLCYARKLHFRCSGVGARVAWYYWPSALIREFIAVFSQRYYLIRIALGYLIFAGLPILMIFWN